MISRQPPIASGESFASLAGGLLRHPWRRELSVDEIPAPQRIAPFSAAIAADVLMAGEEVGNGRLILLHDPAGNDAWDGTFRCVTYARADVDLEMVTDPLLAEVGWSWLTDALASHAAAYTAASGTVTAVSSRAFGEMSDNPDRAEVEIRASWTALISTTKELAAHLDAWQDLLCMTAGLPPTTADVVVLGTRARSAKR
ncbi:MAG TPA: DUF3000 domain-containing protein [Propionibacteriaceae bacterium]|nr:DUF3000 domain-containing protein [Propionibacteriaceae bacterium]